MDSVRKERLICQPRGASNMRLRFLGVGSAEPSADSHNTSLLIDAGDYSLLVDCSGSPAHSILAAGLDLATFTNVFLTHAHTDHVYGLPSLIHSKWMHGGRRPGKRLDVYGNRETVTLAQQMIRVFDFEAKREPVAVRYQSFDETPSCLDGLLGSEVNIRPIAVRHAEMKTHGLLIVNEANFTFFSSDTVIFEGLDAVIGPHTSSWIMDAGGGWSGNMGHAGIRDVIAYADARNFAGTLYLVHLPPTVSKFEAEFRTMNLARPYDVVFPRDNDVIAL